MSRLIRLGVAAALAAGVVLPATADAYTCRPYLWEQTYEVAGHQVEAWRAGWVC